MVSPSSRTCEEVSLIWILSHLHYNLLISFLTTTNSGFHNFSVTSSGGMIETRTSETPPTRWRKQTDVEQAVSMIHVQKLSATQGDCCLRQKQTR